MGECDRTRFMKALICLMLFCVACSKPSEPEPVPPSGLAGSAKVLSHQIYDGFVNEVIKRDQFMYVRLGSNWFALIGVSVKKGQKIKIEEQAVFNNFHSKTLNRTFPKIIFGKLVLPGQVNGPKPVKPH